MPNGTMIGRIPMPERIANLPERMMEKMICLRNFRNERIER
jgi:hypothetical protein